ncbi:MULTISPECIES: hypothetical protein [unclassified Sphingomonas]|uniref:hypothetical protein n=1 Tax=unclassified Sphingomonas TaxID=196159 RepID=UPI0006F2504A|nr:MULTISPECIES: hypothetical protein [unclassified Sphingomonas]KQX18662.1 hypothetical protein ASD17_16165 [Sphingomonas sp. Root1294]KQY72015.1 hypothetical protein ASD39_18810 [Sphingomonas sp. Root50]KRB94717.1 hypothetical protein ASE22_01945 [Sphingomonas sp. Root720]
MTRLSMTRRGLMHGIALAAAIPLACGKAMGAAVAAVDRRTASTAALLRVAFPHARLTPDFYRRVAETYVTEIAAKPAAISEHDRGLALLDASHIAPFADLPPVIQKGLVEKVDQEPFFKAILWRGAELVYRDRSVWKMVGYEGSSLEYGGYHDRGFDDIDWLPKAGVRS